MHEIKLINISHADIMRKKLEIHKLEANVT